MNYKKIILIKFLFPVFFLSFNACTVNKVIEPDSAEFRFFFSPPENSGRFTKTLDSTQIEWNVEEAWICVGEIGIHWNWYTTVALAKRAHDIPGEKISPKIYEYFAVNLMERNHIQNLQAEPGVYDHIHMMLRPSEEKDVKGWSQAPLLDGISLYLSGTIREDGREKKWRLEIKDTFLENSLGDITFKLLVLRDKTYVLEMIPRFDRWFNDILFDELEFDDDGRAHINMENSNTSAARKIINRFTMDNAFLLDVEELR